jgi:hypothetical protein
MGRTADDWHTKECPKNLSRMQIANVLADIHHLVHFFQDFHFLILGLKGTILSG